MGFIEYDEDFLTAALREVKEETGLDVEIRSLLSVVSNFLSPRLHTLAIVLLARVVGGELERGRRSGGRAVVSPCGAAARDGF